MEEKLSAKAFPTRVFAVEIRMSDVDEDGVEDTAEMARASTDRGGCEDCEVDGEEFGSGAGSVSADPSEDVKGVDTGDVIEEEDVEVFGGSCCDCGFLSESSVD